MGLISADQMWKSENKLLKGVVFLIDSLNGCLPQEIGTPSGWQGTYSC